MSTYELFSLYCFPGNDVMHEKKPHLLQPQGSHTVKQALRGQRLTLECIPKGL